MFSRNEAAEVRGTLEAIVSEMRDAGRLDSTGAFTIDASRAIDKMRRFQIERPQDFILWLGAAAVMGGASQLLVTIGISQICVEFDGQQFLPGELEKLLDERASSQPGRIGHLAFALTAALATRPEEIIFESCDQRLQVSPGTTRLSGMSGDKLERARFLIVRQQASPWEDTQFNYLRERIPHKLLKISVNRRRDVGYRLPADLVHGQQFWRGHDHSPLMERLIAGETCRRHSHDRSFSVLLSLDSWHRQSPGQVNFLHDGLLFPIQADSPFCYRAVVSWPDFRLDLSRTAPVDSLELREVVAEVGRLANQVAQEFVRNYAELKPGLRHLALPWLQDLSQSQSSLAPECRRLLQTYHGPGIWLERDDPGKLIQELLQNFTEPPQAMQRSRTSKPPTGFWACLAAMFAPPPIEPQDSQLVHLRQGMNDRKRWRQLLVSLLAVFDPESTLRLGLSAAVADPEWLVLEGLLPDGTHLHLRAAWNSVTVQCFYPKDWNARASKGALAPPEGWKAYIEKDMVRFTGGKWKAPEALLALLECVLASRRQAQSQEQLECPGCRQAMEKVVLDVVLDRCARCRTLWLDYAELEWLLKNHPEFRYGAPPTQGRCPRCAEPLQAQLRANRPGAECTRCRGFWLRPESWDLLTS
ncbi:MAG: zf-TFIIB domain-containing protein [Candidatus Eremiobacteraeota bacterium]|nr:zf-TFIIB domain-containing protein [Candidatus Eremiobacteraeota bacterium]MCW5872130.1 zf-TFIIB domain-containing protein [Candidatus Eremiobacteraeota bacterium]